MTKEKSEEVSKVIKKNPSLMNNPKQDNEHEKKFEAENEGSKKDLEVDPGKQVTKKEIDLDRDGVSFDSGNGSDEHEANPAKPGEKTTEISPKKLH